MDRSMAFFSSSSHKKSRFSPFLLCYRARDGFYVQEGVVEMGNKLWVKGRAEKGCALLFQRGAWGMMVRSVWGMWGTCRGSGWAGVAPYLLKKAELPC
jgi:hypothetical protein